MTGISIFVHAVKMVLNNLGPALRIGVVPLLILAAAGWMFSSNFTSSPGGGPATIPDAGAFGSGFVLMVVSILVSLWIAVAWHRYILLEEEPGAFMPGWNGSAIWAYFKTAFLIGLILIVAAIPLVMVAGILVFPGLASDGEPGLFAGFMFLVIVVLPLTWLGYRFGPSLAGAAVDDRRGLGEAWSATSRGAVDLLVLALVSVVVFWVPSTIVAELPRLLAVPLNAVIQWAATMVGVGVITTIFGHYVQGRALNA